MRALLGLLVVALLLTACGDDDDDGLARTVTTTTTTTTIDDGSPTSPDGDVDDDPDADADAGDANAGGADDADGDGDDQPARSGAEAIVLTVDDMPTGWTSTASEDDADDGETDECFTEAAGDFEDDPDAEAEFQADDFGPFVAATVTVYDDADAAGRALDGLAAGFEACDGDVQTDEDGNETTTRVQPLSFPNLGDETFASRLTFESGFGSGSGDVVVTRVDDVLIFLAHVAVFSGPDTALTEQLQRTMVDRA